MGQCLHSFDIGYIASQPGFEYGSNRWHFGMEKQFRCTRYNKCNDLSILELHVTNVRKKGKRGVWPNDSKVWKEYVMIWLTGDLLELHRRIGTTWSISRFRFMLGNMQGKMITDMNDISKSIWLSAMCNLLLQMLDIIHLTKYNFCL